MYNIRPLLLHMLGEEDAPGLDQRRVQVDVVGHDDGSNNSNSVVDRGPRQPRYCNSCSIVCRPSSMAVAQKCSAHCAAMNNACSKQYNSHSCELKGVFNTEVNSILSQVCESACSICVEHTGLQQGLQQQQLCSWNAANTSDCLTA